MLGKSVSNVRTKLSFIKLTFISCSGSNCSAFYLFWTTCRSKLHPFIMRLRKHRRCVAYVQYCQCHALRKLLYLKCIRRICFHFFPLNSTFADKGQYNKIDHFTNSENRGSQQQSKKSSNFAQ